MLAPGAPSETHEMPIALQPRAWRDTRWVGSLAGRLTTPDLLAGALPGADHQHAVTRVYAAACADLAQASWVARPRTHEPGTAGSPAVARRHVSSRQRVATSTSCSGRCSTVPVSKVTMPRGLASCGVGSLRCWPPACRSPSRR